MDTGSHTRVRLASSGFRQPHDAFIPAVSVGHLSDRIRSWGSSLQGLMSLAQPCAVSSACALLFLGAHPPHRLHVLRTRNRSSATKEHGRTRACCAPLSLQGFAPRENPPPCCSGLDHNPARSSHGILPSRVRTHRLGAELSLLHPLMPLPTTDHHCRNSESLLRAELQGLARRRN